MTLRRSLLLLCHLLLFCSSIAGPIGREQAMRLAERYVKVNKASELRLAQAEQTQGTPPAYYIFNDTDHSGFVIISGDDRTTPILGYSESGQLKANELPIQLAALLDAHKAQVKALSSTPQTFGIPSSNPQPHPKVIKGPLLTCIWGQDEPFNDQTPRTHEQEPTVTGCVATAMAQVMYYHKWPIRGKGSNTYPTELWSVRQLSEDFSQSVYEWDEMIDEYKYQERWEYNRSYKEGFWTEKQGNAVAKLMHDVGIAVNTNYNAEKYGGSGASSENAAQALHKHFSYHVSFLNHSHTPHADFLSAIQNELDRDYPIIISESRGGPGHTWVIDGYDENGYLHANWGWRGSSNGYFALSFMFSHPYEAGMGQMWYTQKQDIILLRPDKDGVEAFAESPAQFSFIHGGGLEFDSRTTDLSSRKIGINLKRLGNGLTRSYRGEIAYSLRDEEGNEVKQYASHCTLKEIGRRLCYPPLQDSITLAPTLSDGSYQIVAICREFIPDSLGRQKNTSPNNWIEVGNGSPLSLEVREGKILLDTSPREAKLVMTQAPLETMEIWTNTFGSTQLAISNTTDFSTGLGYINFNLTNTDGINRDISTETYQFFGHATFNHLISYLDPSPIDLEEGIYDVTFSFIVPSRFIKYADGTKEVIPGKVYPIENPFGQYRIQVIDCDNRPHLVYPYTIDRHLDKQRRETPTPLEIRLGSSLLNDRILDVSKLADNVLSISCPIVKENWMPYKGVIDYSLVDPTTGAKYHLGQSDTLDFDRGIGTVEETRAAIAASVFDRIPANRTYHIHISANFNGEDFDIWSAFTPRYELTILNPAPPSTPKTYQVTLESNEGGKIDIPNIDLDSVQECMTLSVDAHVDRGHRLKSLMANDKVIKTRRRFTVTSDTKVVAVFEKKNFRVFDYTKGEGRLDLIGYDDLDDVPYGTKLIVQASPSPGHRLVSITVNEKEIENNTEITILDKTFVKATFEPNIYRVTREVQGEGEITLRGAEDLNQVAAGTPFSIVANPHKHYRLKSLMANEKDITHSKYFIVVADTKVVAVFAKNTYRVWLPKLEHGKISIPEAVDLDAVESGTMLTLVISPDKGYIVDSVKVNGQPLAAPYKFEVEDDSRVKVSLKQNTSLTERQLSQGVLYPNPAHDFVTISGVAPGTTIRLMSLAGRIVREVRMPETDEWRWSLADLEAGVYIVQIGKTDSKLVIR